MTHCPLHDDRTPSLSLQLEREVWHCHSCGKGGDAYQLIMEKEGIGFARARALATSLNLAARSTGGSDSELSGSRYGRRRTLPAGTRDRPRDSRYVPAWRRR
ncbi:CHC2 zinc finger domain-containing protein [Actinoplanes sp. NPDC049118]|uniref:CHC2 zinc finger domain-containing protein n=1 Tax=Actinoplanes sp. NPDC049118 TaxID=3155769 RepID=UPI003404DDE7